MRASTYLLPLLLGCTALAGCVVAPMQGQLAPGQYATNSTVSAPGEITEPPPPLQEYEQPPIPAEGYIWTPPFWQYGRSGYYWVPGVWVEPPSIGLLWTPGYWGFSGGYYRWNAPYWGPTVGFYGGINYGFGYFGRGYEGGRWDGGRFHYNQTVNNFGGRRVTNVYNAPVQYRGEGGRTSFNGGANGVRAQAVPGQVGPGPDQRRPPTAAQSQHFQSAQGNTGFQQRGNPGATPGGLIATPGGPIARPGGQTPAGATPQRQNFGQQPNYAPQQPQQSQQPRPGAQAPPMQQRPQPTQQPPQQQAAPARQAPQAQPQPQRQQPPPQQRPGQRPPGNSQERP